MTIKDKAKKAAGRARCNKCKFWLNQTCISSQVAEVCYENYIKGYLKGYKQRRKEERK